MGLALRIGAERSVVRVLCGNQAVRVSPSKRRVLRRLLAQHGGMATGQGLNRTDVLGSNPLDK